MKKLSSLILALVLLASLSIPALAQTTVKLGLVGEVSDQWQPVVAKLAAEGVTLELVKFADYTLPNRALADKEIDLNAFQHYAFLNKEIANFGFDLTVIGDTIIAPLGLYSRKIKSVSEIKDGDKIAIPSDATNGGRAIKLLETAGLLKVDPAAGFVPEKSDITEYLVKVEIIEVEASLTAGLLPDVTASIINGNHAVDNGLFPATDAIFLEQVGGTTDNPYINVLVARTEDKDNPLYQKILAYYRSPEVAEILATVFKGALIPTWDVNAK